MSWSTVVLSNRAALKMLFRASPVQLNMRGVTGGTTRHKYDKKNLLSKDANGSEARVDLRVTGWASPVRSVRESAMGRYATCGPTCFKKRSGPDSMSGDARARFLEALSKGQFIIGADDPQMLAPVTEESLIDEGFTMAAAVQVQNEESVENLVHVESSAMVRPRVCNVSCTL